MDGAYKKGVAVLMSSGSGETTKVQETFGSKWPEDHDAPNLGDADAAQ